MYICIPANRRTKKKCRYVSINAQELRHSDYQTTTFHYTENIQTEHSTWISGRISLNEQNVKNSVNVFPYTRKLKNTLKTFKRALLAITL